MNTRQMGNFGERIAENYLTNKGYQILDRNYSSKTSKGPLKGEIDIVAKKSDIVSFIEVKTLRNPAALIAPEEKVNFSKQRKLRITAESWLMKKQIPLDVKWQIDIVAINFNPKTEKADISHFENAISYC